MCMVTKLNQEKHIWNVSEETNAGQVYTQILNTKAISLSPDTFQIWMKSIPMNKPPQTMQSN